MTAAQVRDALSRLPRCAGQASDAVLAYTQVKMERSKIVQTAGILMLGCFGFVYLDPVGQNCWTKFKNMWLQVEGICADNHMFALASTNRRSHDGEQKEAKVPVWEH